MLSQIVEHIKMNKMNLHSFPYIPLFETAYYIFFLKSHIKEMAKRNKKSPKNVKKVLYTIFFLLNNNLFI